MDIGRTNSMETIISLSNRQLSTDLRIATPFKSTRLSVLDPVMTREPLQISQGATCTSGLFTLQDKLCMEDAKYDAIMLGLDRAGVEDDDIVSIGANFI